MMRYRATRIAAAAGLTAALAAGCSFPAGVDDGSGSRFSPPITIGISLSLTGALQSDGRACKKGYELWASHLNSSGGLLGRRVRLIILDDKSNPNDAENDYIRLITKDHVDLTLALFLP